MNNYTLNQARRADESPIVKAVGLFFLLVFPWKEREIWSEHCERMQRRLDNERALGYGERYIDKQLVKF